MLFSSLVKTKYYRINLIFEFKAISENAFRIMSLLHLTPIVPFGPVSYMTGGLTSIPLVPFALANTASMPLLILYVFLGASAGRLLRTQNRNENGGNSIVLENGNDVHSEIIEGKIGHTEDDQQLWLVLLGICMSTFSIFFISYSVKKELKKIFDKQERRKLDETTDLEDLILTVHEEKKEMEIGDEVTDVSIQ